MTRKLELVEKFDGIKMEFEIIPSKKTIIARTLIPNIQKINNAIKSDQKLISYFKEIMVKLTAKENDKFDINFGILLIKRKLAIKHSLEMYRSLKLLADDFYKNSLSYKKMYDKALLERYPIIKKNVKKKIVKKGKKI